MVKAKKFIYASTFKGEPKVTDFKLVEEDLPPLKDGEILIQAVYLSIDPYQRAYQFFYKIGQTMLGGQVAKILESKNPAFPVGKFICTYVGWRTHTVFNPSTKSDLHPNLSGRDDFLGMTYLLPDFGSVPVSLGIGAVGMPGNSAYFGFLEGCQPKEGETLVVSGAAGAVGSIAGQIGKIKGLKVIGIAGSNDKCKWLTNELGFDHAINYKTENIPEALKKAAPEGVDCYFDNVGGKITSEVLKHMNLLGRISVVGSISAYNADETNYPQVRCPQLLFLSKQLKMEGVTVSRFIDRWTEGLSAILKWIQEGKIKYRETITDGFENMPTAFIDMLRGGNTGKAVVKA